MRKSLLLGVLSCTLIIAGNTTEKAAATTQTKQADATDTSIVELLADANGAELVVLAQLADNKPEETLDKKPDVIKHIVVEDETLEKIAKKYDITWQRLFDKNTKIVDPNIISLGDELIIPDQSEKLDKREVPVSRQPKRVASSVNSTSRSSNNRTASVVPRGSASGNGYVAGYCTWYAKSRRPDLPNKLGNASSWVTRAAAQGIATGYSPRSGAIAQRNNHVAYVESVNGDGTMTISDMNYRNLYEITTRTVSASDWKFIY